MRSGYDQAGRLTAPRGKGGFQPAPNWRNLDCRRAILLVEKEMEGKEERKVIRRAVIVLILTALLTMALPTVPALAAAEGSQADDLLIHGVSCSPDGAFSADGFAGKLAKNGGSVAVTIDFVGVCPDGQVLTLTVAEPAYLLPLPNPNAKPNGKSNGYNWSVNDGIVTIPEVGPVSWSATHIKVTLTNKAKSVIKETNLPLPCSPF
jgi:hypothetical protein